MKKILLGIAALVLLGTTAFAAISQEVVFDTNGVGTAAGTLPVVVQGNVIDTTNVTLVITPLTNADTNGTTMTFNFGDLYRGQQTELIGTYKAEIIQNDILAATTGGTINSALLIGGLEQSGGQGVSFTGTASDIVLGYELSASTTALDSPQAHTGSLRVIALVDSGVTSFGTFLDSTAAIEVTAAGVTLGSVVTPPPVGP